MSWASLVLFYVHLIIAGARSSTAVDYDRVCTGNEETTDCANACIPTCYRPNSEQHCMINPKYCKKGCKCKPGYVRPFKESEECIELEDCANEVLTSDEADENPNQCHENEEPSKCANACIRTCHNPNPPCHNINNLYKCIKGCKCKPSFVRRHGICMLLEDCPNEFYETESSKVVTSINECGLNQQPGQCINACVPTCSNPKPENCMLEEEQFCVEGCECTPGYVRPTLRSDQCILVKYCALEKY